MTGGRVTFDLGDCLDDQPNDGLFAENYDRFASLGDLFRQIGPDERHHKQESLHRMALPRFS